MTKEEIIKGFSLTSCKTYIGNSSNNKTMLVIVPDLDLNGAQTVLCELLNLKYSDYRIVILSPSDGEYRSTYSKQGYDIVVKPYVSASDEFRTFLQTSFDLIFINSSSCILYLYYFINTKVRVLFWLHESKEQLESTQTNFINPHLLSNNITFYGVIKRVQRGIKELYSYDIEILHMPIKDLSKEVTCDPCQLKSKYNVPDDKVLFFIPGAYTYIKGQDILLEAITKLPETFFRKSFFVFCGYELEGQKEYYKSIHALADKLNNVLMLEKLPREEVYNWYNAADCVVAPSRIDSTPTTIIEAMMFHKLTLVSKGAGISEYIKDCIDGFVFGDLDELNKRLLLIIDNPAALTQVREAGYMIYKKYFSPDA